MKKYLLPLFVGALLVGCGSKEETQADVLLAEGVDAGPLLSEDDLPVETAPEAPRVSYKPVMVEDDSIDDGVFKKQYLESGSVLSYQSRAGVLFIMEDVVEYPDMLGYLSLEKAWRFDDRYVLVVSTGENGNSCPATTYAIAFDTREERVTGSVLIDGCDENIEALSEGNKLTIRKEGESHVFYNGIVE